MRRLALSVVLAASVALPAGAQDAQTLADIRQELSVLYVELQGLRRELSTTGGAAANLSGDTLQRVDLIEAELGRLTSRTEQLEFRINRVVQDGTNRVGDLEFRLCELEAGCDIATLGETPSLGGEAPATAPVTAPTVTETTAQLAVGEQDDFERAIQELANGEPSKAAEMLASFVETYPGTPLTGEAHFYRGEALAEIGRDRDAGLAYLESFSTTPGSPVAADALLGLGVSLAKLGQMSEACATLGEVGARFPSSPRVADATEERTRLGCS